MSYTQDSKFTVIDLINKQILKYLLLLEWQEMKFILVFQDI